ncbi:conserved protein of unknown function [Rhodovastum atsumiense]|uniref:DUF3311 domain-containing protein n=1 Tax=Rhodovastum atsumiense TaxID=504468 RepID=A0A5M6IXG4_9PROT|nr:hypothetical protein [Rhodovastum atsumiense]KAA5612088.1 hypothetical protein F1189_11570 [Rhodovastum atsumiense]CAH2604037.1 conserved protein of unknown function [Rhodovastum atsumiense]
MPAMNPDPDTRARLGGLFLLGLVLFLPPVIGLPGEATLFGIPVLFVAVYAGWAVVILLLGAILRRARRRGGEGG